MSLFLEVERVVIMRERVWLKGRDGRNSSRRRQQVEKPRPLLCGVSVVLFCIAFRSKGGYLFAPVTSTV